MRRFVENVPIIDTYADGVVEVENLGSNFRTIYFVWQKSPTGLIEKVAVAKIVRPVDSIVNSSRESGLHALLSQSPPLRAAGKTH